MINANVIFLTLLLRPIQIIVRTLLEVPATSTFMWKNVYRIRHYFSIHATNKPFVTLFDENIKINVSLDDHIESQIFWQDVQEGDRGEVSLLKSLLMPQHTFIDVGGNIGVFSLLAAKRLTSGKVYTFEPSEYHLKKLESNLRLNQFENIHVQPVALSNKSQSSKLYFPPAGVSVLNNTGMASQFGFDKPSSITEDIVCVRLDDYIESLGISHIDIMKIDVEGAEMDVLSGASKTIYFHRPHVVMEVNLDHLQRAGRNAQEMIDYWHSLDYSLFRIGHEAELFPIYASSEFITHQNIYCKPGNKP